MTENRREARVIVGYQVVGERAAIQSSKDVQAALGRMRGETAATELTAKRLQVALEALDRGRTIQAIGRDFADAAQRGKDLESETSRVIERLRAVGATDEEVRQVAIAYDQAAAAATRTADASVVAQQRITQSAIQSRLAIAEATRASQEDPGSFIGGLRSDVLGGAAAGGGFNARSAGDRIRGVGIALRNLPSTPIPGTNLTTDAVGNLTRGVGSLVPAIAALGPVGIAAGAAVVGLTIATSAYLDEVNKAAEAERKRLEVVRTVREQARQQTGEELQTSLSEAQQELNAANDTLRDLSNTARDAFNNLSLGEQRAANLGGILTRVNQDVADYAELNDAVTRQRERVAELTTTYNELSLAQDDNLTAQQDAIAAQEKLKDASARAAEQAENLADKLNDIAEQEKQVVLQNEIKTATALANEKLAELENQLKDIGALDLTKFTQLANELKEAGAAQAAKDATLDNELKRVAQLATLTEAAKAVTDQAEKNREAVASFQELQTRASAAIAQAEQRVTDAIAQGEQARNDVLQKSNDEAAKIGTDYGIARVRAEEDLARELRKIERDRLRSTTLAEGERDAYAAFQANLRAKDAKDDAKEEADVEARRRKEDYERRIRELAQATSKELQILKRRTDDSVAAARAALSVEQSKWNAEINLRQQALNEMLRQYNIFLSALRAAQAQTSRQVYVPNTVQVPVVSGQSAYERYAAYQRSQGIPGFANGGVAQGLARVNDGGGVESAYVRNKVMMFTEPTRIFSAQDTARLFSGASGGSRQNGPISMLMRIDGQALNKMMDGRAVRVVAEVMGDD